MRVDDVIDTLSRGLQGLLRLLSRSVCTDIDIAFFDVYHLTIHLVDNAVYFFPGVPAKLGCELVGKGGDERFESIRKHFVSIEDI
jgi:hypothetical protein